jgi:hypothetical protein
MNRDPCRIHFFFAELRFIKADANKLNNTIKSRLLEIDGGRNHMWRVEKMQLKSQSNPKETLVYDIGLHLLVTLSVIEITIVAKLYGFILNITIIQIIS